METGASHFGVPNAAGQGIIHRSILLVVDTAEPAATIMGDVESALNRFKADFGETWTADMCVDICVLAFNGSCRTVCDWHPISGQPPTVLESEHCWTLDNAIITGIDVLRERSRGYGINGIPEAKPYLLVLTGGLKGAPLGIDGAIEYAARLIGSGRLECFFVNFDKSGSASASRIRKKSGTWRIEPLDCDVDIFGFLGYLASNDHKVIGSLECTEEIGCDTDGASAPIPSIRVDADTGVDAGKAMLIDLDSWLADGWDESSPSAIPGNKSLEGWLNP